MHTTTPSTGRWRRVLTALVALLMATSVAIGAGAGAVVAASDDPAQRSLQENDDGTDNQTLDPADEIYVKENGDAVLYYEDENDAGADISSAEYGLSVGQGLFYGLVVTDLEEEQNTTGAAHAVLEPGSLTAEGNLTTVRPQAIEELSLTIDGVRNQQRNRFDAEGRAVVATRSAPSLALVETADLSMDATVAADSFDASGSLTAETATQLGQPMSASFELVEGEGTYTLDAAQEQQVREFAKDQWDTRERARQTIRERYASIAESLGGSATVTLNSYTFANTSQRGVYQLDVAYTVEYEGIDDGLERQMAAYLANSEEFDLSREQASDIAANVTDLTVERIAADYSMASRSVEGSFDVQLENYSDALLAGIDALAAYSPQAGGDPIQPAQLENVRARVEAQRAADLTRTYSLTASHRLESQERAVVEVQAQSRTQNWQAYVSELESRDIDVPGVEYSLAADTAGDDIVANGSFTVEQEDLVDSAVQQFLDATEEGAAEDDDVQQARSFARAFREAGFRKARVDVRATEGDVTVEGGAKFDDMAAFRDVLQQSGRIDLSITEVVGRTNESGSLNQYVYVTGAVEAGASESAVRELSVVDEDTTVHMPGTYDRTFPEMDTVRAYNYLGIDTPTPTAGGGDGSDGSDGDDGSTGSGGQPGFGVAAALAALAAAALLARRRN